MAEKKKWYKVGGLWKSKKNAKTKYISINCPKKNKDEYDKEPIKNLIGRLEGLLEDPTGYVNLMMAKPADEIARLLDYGIITEEEAEKKLGYTPENLMYQITLPPED